MRALRVAPPCQLALPISDGPSPVDQWAALPEPQRAQALALLARLIARGVIEGGQAGGEATDE